MTKPRTNRAFRAVVASLGLVLAISGCARESPDNVKVQLNWFPNGENAFWYFGVPIFRKHGITLSVSAGKGSELSARLLVAGSADVGVMSADAFLAARERNSDLVSLGVLYPKNPVVVYTLDPRIAALGDLKGRRVGIVPGANTQTLFTAVLRLNHVDPSKVTMVSMDGNLLQQSLMDRNIDAAVGYSFDTAVFVQRHLHYTMIPLSDKGMRVIGLVIAARRESGERLVQLGFVPALKDTLQQANLHRDLVLKGMKAGGASPSSNPVLDRAKEGMVLDVICGALRSCAGALDQSSRMWQDTISQLRDAQVIARDQNPNDFMVSGKH